MGAVDAFGLFAGGLEDREAGEEHRFGLLVREADVIERAEEIESYPSNSFHGGLICLHIIRMDIILPYTVSMIHIL